MENLSNPKITAEYLTCLSILEKYKALIYSRVADALEQPLAKSLLLSISQDGTKHSTLLKGMANSCSDSKMTVDDCAKNVGGLYSLVGECVDTLTRNGKEELEFSQLAKMLTGLESGFGDEYSTFLQSSSLRLIVKGINQSSIRVNLKSIKDVFESILRDQETHGKLLNTMKGMFPESSIEQEPIRRKEKPAERSSTPEVKYQNPDGWISALPPTTYDSNS